MDGGWNRKGLGFEFLTVVFVPQVMLVLFTQFNPARRDTADTQHPLY